MSICILPTIVRTTEESLLAVPESYKEGALALGAGKLRVILSIVLPCAMPGILTAVILGMGRLVGESAALMFTSGMAYEMPQEVLGHVMDAGPHPDAAPVPGIQAGGGSQRLQHRLRHRVGAADPGVRPQPPGGLLSRVLKKG